MAQRRGAGEGSVYRQPDGGWIAAVELGRDSTGKRVRKTAKAKTKREVLAKIEAIKARHAAGLPVSDDKRTTAEYLDHWLDNVLPGTVKERTEASYRWVIGKNIVPHIGKIPLAQLSPIHVQTMMRTLENQGLSPRTRQYTRAILRRALGRAEKDELVRRNAAALVDAPKGAGTKLDDALDADQALAVLDIARGDRLEALAVLVLAVGLRQGETFNLRWDDVDLDAGTLTIREAKTDAGRRTVALPNFVVAALRAHRVRQLEERLAAVVWQDPALVFASTTGTRLDPRNVLRWWHDLTIRAGVGRRRFHASRHTAATLMLNAGVPLEVVSATLGHAGYAITADVYAKVRPQLQRRAADAMEGVLGGAGGGEAH